MKLSLLPLVAAAVSLSSCDQVKEAAEKRADAALERVKTRVEQDIREAVQDSDLMKSGRDYAEKAKSVLGGVDLERLKAEVEQVKSAIASGDYVKAEELSQAVDKFLGVNVVSDSIGLMKIRTDQGAEAAQRKLAEHLALPGLDSRQRENLEKIGGHLANFDGNDRDASLKILALSVASGCEAKFGHGAGGLALMAMDSVFPGMLKDGSVLPAETTPVEAE